MIFVYINNLWIITFETLVRWISVGDKFNIGEILESLPFRSVVKQTERVCGGVKEAKPSTNR